MPEWKPEYDNVKVVKRSPKEDVGPNEALAKGAGCVVGLAAAAMVAIIGAFIAFSILWQNSMHLHH